MLRGLYNVLCAIGRFVKFCVKPVLFWILVMVTGLAYAFYALNSARVAGDAEVAAAVPAIVAEQLADPAVVESFRGEQGSEGPQGPVGMTGDDGAPGPQGEPGICPDCATATATATTATATSATPIAPTAPTDAKVLVYQPVTVNGRGAPAGKIPTGGGSWTVTNNGGTVVNAPVTVN